MSNPLATTYRFAYKDRGTGQIWCPWLIQWNTLVGRNFKITDRQTLEADLNIYKHLERRRSAAVCKWQQHLIYDLRFLAECAATSVSANQPAVSLLVVANWVCGQLPVRTAHSLSIFVL